MVRVVANANPTVLGWARRMAGLDVASAARKAGTRDHRLESWERGDDQPTVVQLRRLADAYKRPLAVFFMDEPPQDDPFPRDFRRESPDAADAATPALRLAVREAHFRREAALDLYAELDEQPATFELTTSLDSDPEAVAAALRAALVEDDPPSGGDPRQWLSRWRAAAEALGVLVFQAQGIDVDEMRGFSISDRPLPVVVLNIKDAWTARSFSLMHELAHVMLNRGGLCLNEDDGPRSERQRVETFCNHVAGATLVPEPLLVQRPEVPGYRTSQMSDEDIAAIARQFGVSREVVVRRLLVLDRVDEPFYQRKRAEYAAAVKRGSPQRRGGGFAPPSTLTVATAGRHFTKLVLQAYDEERITSSDVAEYLGVRLKHLERIRAAVVGSPANGRRG